MNKNELVKGIAEETAMSQKDAKSALEATLEIIKNHLANGDKVQLIGFGTFEVRDRAARKGRNPQTGAEITIPASKSPSFKPGKNFKEAVNK